MNKQNAKDFLRRAQMSIKKHSPEILTGIGIAGMATTTVLAVKATPKAIQLIESEYGDNNGHPVPKKEVIKICWRLYIPAAIMGTLSISCLVGASSVNVRRNAALATAYKISETALTEYREKVIETIGENKEHDIRDKIAKEKVEKTPVNNRQVIITGKGDSLCYESISGRYFNSNIDKLKSAINELNEQLLSEMYISLTDFYSAIGLEPTSISDLLGWKLDDGIIKLYFSSQLTDDGTPCLVIDYDAPPKYDYANFE